MICITWLDKHFKHEILECKKDTWTLVSLTLILLLDRIKLTHNVDFQ